MRAGPFVELKSDEREGEDLESTTAVGEKTLICTVLQSISWTRGTLVNTTNDLRTAVVLLAAQA